MNDRERWGATRWDFYALLVKVGLPLIILGTLFFLARKGDPVALGVLIAAGVLFVVFLGGLAVLVILGQLHKAEQIRFNQNLRENMMLLDKMQRIQANQNQQLLAQNAKLVKMIPDPERKPLDVDTLAWDLIDDDLEMDL